MRSIIALFRSWFKKLIALLTGKDITDDPTPVDPVNDDPATDDPTTDLPDRPIPDPGIVCYYGCPNSKRAQKLQLSKQLYR